MSRPNRMAELKLDRLNQHVARLRDDLVRPRIRVSEAAMSLIRYARTTRDPLLPAVWGTVARDEDPFHQEQSRSTCCVVI